MKKKTCEECGARMDKHIIARVYGRLTWLCPDEDAA